MPIKSKGIVYHTYHVYIASFLVLSLLILLRFLLTIPFSNLSGLFFVVRVSIKLHDINFNAINKKQSHLFLFVSIQFGGSNMASLACVSFMCLVQCLLAAHQLSSSFGPTLPPFFPLKNQCNRCLVPLAQELHGWKVQEGGVGGNYVQGLALPKVVEDPGHHGNPPPLRDKVVNNSYNPLCLFLLVCFFL